jgi:hypothetical protein
MSHIVKLDFECNNLTHLKNGVKEGFDGKLEFVENQQKFLYYSGQYGNCDHVIRVVGKPEAYQIGVIDNKDGTYGFRWDSYNGGKGLVEVVGKDAVRLKQEYNAQVGMAEARRKGFRNFKRTINEKGRLIVEAY